MSYCINPICDFYLKIIQIFQSICTYVISTFEFVGSTKTTSVCVFWNSKLTPYGGTIVSNKDLVRIGERLEWIIRRLRDRLANTKMRLKRVTL